MATFPGGIFVWTTRVDNTDNVVAADVNGPANETIAIQTKVGVDSSAVATSHDYKFRHLPAQEANWDAGAYEIRAETFESDVTTGTAPLTVASTTVVTNLNADTVDGVEAAALFPARSGDMLLSSNGATPSGWTNVSATYSNKFIRINASALSASGSDTHTHGGVTGAHTLSLSEIPAHTHDIDTMGDGALSAQQISSTSWTNPQVRATKSAGSGGSHTHTVSSADNVPVYVTLIMYQKD